MKKRLSLLLTLTMILSFSFSTVSFASSNEAKHTCDNTIVEQQNIVTPNSIGCPKCSGSLSSTTYAAEWVYNGNVKTCKDHFSCVIKTYERIVTITYQCNNCEYGFTNSHKEYRYEHVTV